MKTDFANLNQLKTLVEQGQPVYIENHTNPTRSRLTKVKNKMSYFFTVENLDGKESWIIPGAVDLKNYSFSFDPSNSLVNIYFKPENKPFLTLYFKPENIVSVN